ncbi:MAG: glycosyltransferase family 2 protein [Sedimentisphaerales bacterium]|nr:glycosyltransferase family 2 protein [Sedimentisphaerales bacterium]
MFSIIIPTYNASKHLPSLLKSLQLQTIKDYELIIIDSSSTDNTIEIADSYNACVIKIDKENFDHGSTRTIAAKKAQGEIIIFLSQDAILCDENSIEYITTPFNKDEQIAAVFGRQLPDKDASIFAQHLRLFNYSENSYVSELSDKEKHGLRTIFFSNSFSAFKKTTLEEIGFFKEGLIFGEDTYTAAKLLMNNKKIAYASSAKVYHSHNYTISQDFRRYFDMGVFHQKENWLLKEFGKAEGQGMKYIKSEFAFIKKNKRLYLLPEFVVRIFAKYLGYKMGRYYNVWPKSLNKKMSLNRSWWEKSY